MTYTDFMYALLRKYAPAKDQFKIFDGGAVDNRINAETHAINVKACKYMQSKYKPTEFDQALVIMVSWDTQETKRYPAFPTRDVIERALVAASEGRRGKENDERYQEQIDNSNQEVATTRMEEIDSLFKDRW